MNKNRLEAFSDGVLAIIITIMVLELKTPPDASFASLLSLAPTFLSYVLSFIYIGIYWSNHHHLMHLVQRVNGAVLWANLHLLFWLSLVPFATRWMGEHQFAQFTVALYGIMLLGAACAYFILAHVLLREHGKDSKLALALGDDFKGKISIVFYVIGIALSFVHTALSLCLYTLVATIWLVPDRRIEKVVQQ